MIDVEAIRAQIPVCQRSIYMNTGWSGPSPLPVLDAIRGQLELESVEGPASPRVIAVSREVDAEARTEVAALVGASVEEIALLESTTEGLHVVLNALDWKANDEAITFGVEHSSPLVSTLYLQSKDVAVKVLELAPEDRGDAILEKVSAALGPRTRVICMSHVQYATGLRMPLAEVCALAQRRGVQVLVDGAQAVGQLPLDLPGMGVDYYAMPGQKWLLGPDGVSMLYVRPDHLGELHARNPYLAGRGVRAAERHLEPQESVRKLELSTSSTALRAGLTAAIRFIRSAGLEEIQGHNLALAAALKDGLAALDGVNVLSPMDPDMATGLVAARLTEVPARPAVEALWGRWRIAARSIEELDAVRFSLHFFNTESEVERVVAAVTELAREGY